MTTKNDKSTDGRYKVTPDQVYAAIGKRASGKTVNDLAENLTVTPATVRKHLKVLQETNRVTTKETLKTERRGRPAQLYIQAATTATAGI